MTSISPHPQRHVHNLRKSEQSDFLKDRIATGTDKDYYGNSHTFVISIHFTDSSDITSLDTAYALLKHILRAYMESYNSSETLEPSAKFFNIGVNI